MGYEYIATIEHLPSDVVLRKLETVAHHITSVAYADHTDTTFGFNPHGMPADTVWGNYIQLSYHPQIRQMYLLINRGPERELLEELPHHLKEEGLEVSFEEACDEPYDPMVPCTARFANTRFAPSAGGTVLARSLVSVSRPARRLAARWCRS